VGGVGVFLGGPGAGWGFPLVGGWFFCVSFLGGV